MTADYILKVTGNILLNIKGVEARALSCLTEESDLRDDLELTIHQLKRVLIALSEHFYLNLSEDYFEHTNMKFWIQRILMFDNTKKQISKENESKIAA